MRIRRLLLSLLVLAFAVGLVRTMPVMAQAQKVVRLALPEGDANSLDPQQLQTLAEGQILSQIYEGLVQYDQKTLQPVPDTSQSESAALGSNPVLEDEMPSLYTNLNAVAKECDGAVAGCDRIVGRLKLRYVCCSCH